MGSGLVIAKVPLDKVKAVSYTHLDVYKRQWMKRPDVMYYSRLQTPSRERFLIQTSCKVRSRKAKAMRILSTVHTSVSYTHLDVYKRQGEGSYGDNQPDIVEAQDPFGNIEQKEEEQQIGGLDLEEVE